MALRRKNVIEFTIKVVDDASRRLRNIGTRIAAMAKRVAVAAATMAAAFAAAGAALLAFVNKTTKSIDELDKLGIRLGVSVEALSQLQFVADRSGISFKNMTLSLQRMGRRVAEAAVGMGEAQQALFDLNLSAADLNKLPIETQFKAILTALDGVESSADRLRIAFKLFDSEGVSVLQTLDGGIEGFNSLIREADRFNAVLGRDAVDAAKEFQDAMANLRGAGRGLANSLSPLIPLLTSFINKLAEGIPVAVANTRIALAHMQVAFANSVSFVADSLENLSRNMAILVQRFDSELATSLFKQAEQFRVVAEEMKSLGVEYVSLIDAAEAYKKAITEGTGTTTGLSGDPAVNQFQFPELKPEEYGPRLRKFSITFEKTMNFVADAAKGAAMSIQRAFADFLFDPFEEGLKGLLTNFLNVIRRMVSEMLAFKILSNIPGLGSFFGSGVARTTAIPGRAGGGDVTAGRPFMVGERGPELFVPNASGRIVPNQQLHGSMNPQFITHIDAKGADPGLIARLPQIMEQRDKQLMLKMKRFFETGHVLI